MIESSGGTDAVRRRERGVPEQMARSRWRRRVAQLLGVVTMTVAMLLGLSGPAMAEGEWTNHQTTMIIRDHGLYVGTVEVAIWTQNRDRANVHARVWGDGFSGWTHSENVGSFTTYRGWVTVNKVLPAGSRVCAEGFYGSDSVGLPCVTIVQ